MRLPQSSSPLPSFRSFSIPLNTALAIALLFGAQAFSQQLQCVPAHLKFGTVTIGQTESQYVILTNTGTTDAKISAISESQAQFNVSGISLPYTLSAGKSVTVKATFAPNAAGFTSGKTTFTSTASNSSLHLGLVGTGVTSEALTTSPASLPFGAVAVGASSTLPVVLTNNLTRKQTLTAFQMSGSAFTVSGPSLPLVLTPGQSATVQVTFSPQSAGALVGSLFISGPAQNIPLNGTGTTIGQLSVSPGSLNFGSVMVGNASTQTAVLAASGGAVTISSASSSNAQFAFLGTTFPLTIAAGKSTQVNVIFTPQKAGTTSSTLSFSSNASNSQATEAASGSGTNPQVSLGWTPSTSDVQGYNVYRGTAAGTYTRLNSALDTGTSYTDTTVSSGATYYYAATSVNSAGMESAYSSPLKVVIP